MISRELEASFQSSFAKYLEGWGPISWSKQNISVPASPDLARVFWALSNIEDDSQIMRRKLHYAGIDKSAVIRDFNICWLAEEGEHARALGWMADQRGHASVGRMGHGVRDRDSRSGLANLALFGLRRGHMSLLAGYLVLGTVQEYVALSTYLCLAGMPETSKYEATILQDIARQEGRHMRFYRSCAQSVLEAFPGVRGFVETALVKFWRPPGVDLLGAGEWAAVFGPLLQDDWLAQRMLGVDALLAQQFGLACKVADRIPGLDVRMNSERGGRTGPQVLK